MMYKAETLPEEQAEAKAAAVIVAQMHAQGLTDEQALQCRAIYPAWSPDSVQYEVDYKVLHEDCLLYTSMAGIRKNAIQRNVIMPLSPCHSFLPRV